MSVSPQSRVKRSHAQARAAYNAMSKFYDLMAGSTEWKYKQIGMDDLAICVGETVLEIGTGTGQCLPVLSRAAAENGLICGMDLSEGMLSVAQKRLQKINGLPYIPLQCADALRLPYRGAAFDALFISFTLELFDTPEIQWVLAECRRVLKPTGRLCVVAMSKQQHVTGMEMLYEWMHKHFEAYSDCRPIFLQDALQAAGFSIQTEKRFRMFGLPVDVVLAVNQWV